MLAVASRERTSGRPRGSCPELGDPTDENGELIPRSVGRARRTSGEPSLRRDPLAPGLSSDMHRLLSEDSTRPAEGGACC